jgi:G8 domain
MYVDSIILNGGQLIAGQSPSQPFISSIDIIMTNTAPININLPSEMPSAVTRSILVFGDLRFYGPAHNTVWTRLARTARMGENLITLRERIYLSVGDEIVITTTDSSLSHTERHRVASIVNSTTLRLVNTLGYTHQVITQVFQNGRSIDIAAVVGLLTRNIRIRSRESSVSSLSGWNMFISRFLVGRTYS